MKKLLRLLRTPQLMSGKPSIDIYAKDVNHREAKEVINRQNEVEIQRASLELQREALQHSLNISYGSLVASIMASVAAILAVVIALVKD